LQLREVLHDERQLLQQRAIGVQWNLDRGRHVRKRHACVQRRGSAGLRMTRNGVLSPWRQVFGKVLRQASNPCSTVRRIALIECQKGNLYSG
jgi:hypothetical protein